MKVDQVFEFLKTLNVSFNHKPQGFGNLRSYVLVGSDKNKVYGVSILQMN